MPDDDEPDSRYGKGPCGVGKRAWVTGHTDERIVHNFPSAARLHAIRRYTTFRLTWPSGQQKDSPPGFLLTSRVDKSYHKKRDVVNLILQAHTHLISCNRVKTRRSQILYFLIS